MHEYTKAIEYDDDDEESETDPRKVRLEKTTKG
jgi:hypothetical protein